MPGFVFTADQIATLIEFSGLGEPIVGSPLFPQPAAARPLHPNHPAFEKLIEMHAVEASGDGWRVNLLVGAALRASLEPQEVISVGTGQQPRPRGFAVVRREDFLAECTVDGYGNTKLYFPLSRSQLMLLIGDALTSAKPEPEPTGFRFVGPAEDAFTFAAAMRELRELPVPLTAESLVDTVQRTAGTPHFAAPFATTSGVAPIEALATSPPSIRAALERLISDGHLRVVDGALEPSAAAAAMLGEYPDRAFAVSRAVIGDDGSKTQSLTVSRVGGRTLVFRMHYPADGPALFEWAEVDRAQLRTLVTALLMTEEQFRLSTTGALGAEATSSTVAEQAISARTVSFCPACGSPVSEGDRFCAGCGTGLPTT